MSQRPQPPTTSELRVTLEHVLGNYFGESCAITHLTRKPAANQSSFALEELTLRFDDETELTVLFKDLSWSALLDGARESKPDFLYNPLRELKSYEEILSQQKGFADEPIGAICYGSLVDELQNHYWLFLEKVAGLELYYVALETWQEVARWLGKMHTHFAQQANLLTQQPYLLIYNSDFYKRWLCRARNFVQHSESYTEESRQQFEWLAERYDPVVESLLALPVTFIHGEFYASNVLVEERPDGLRVCPIDWEMAAVGPGLLDLAALIAGTWTEEEKRTLALSYYEALGTENDWESEESFLTALAYCRLHVAVQWLGWSSNWTPPPEQAQNWLSEASYLAEKLKL